MDTSREHAERVERVAKQVAEYARRGEQVRIAKKKGVSHVVPLPGDQRFTQQPVDVSDLDHVLSVDREARICVAEPGAPFARVVEATLEHGLLPTVVPELEGITLGGAVAGCSVEAMSYKYGGFHDSALEYELVDGEGKVRVLTPESDPMAFQLVHGSYGTLGILTRIRFRLVPAKKYVRLEYRSFPTIQAFHDEMMARCKADDFDFVDGILHGPRHHVLCLGRFVDDPPYVSDYRHTEIYYKSTATRREDYLTTADYCFRYDTECHWLTRTVPPLEWKPVRWLLGRWFLGSTNVIAAYKRMEPVFARKLRPDVVCDIFVPQPRFLEFFDWYEKSFKFWPLWIVPYRIPTMYPWVNPAFGEAMKTDFFVDCAVYGKPNEDPSVDWSVELENKTFELGGIKTLIGRNHYTPERFWQVYNRPDIEATKARLDPAGVFPSFFRFHQVG